jgi:hypothetical protein
MTTKDLRATKGFLEERMNRKSEWYFAVRKGRGRTDIGMARSLADPKKVAEKQKKGPSFKEPLSLLIYLGSTTISLG